jgi:hypothetical protein
MNDFYALAIYVTPGVLEAIKAGKAITDIVDHGGASMQYLWSLPAAKDFCAYFHPRTDWVKDASRVRVVEGIHGCPISLKSSIVFKTTPHSGSWQRALDLEV